MLQLLNAGIVIVEFRVRVGDLHRRNGRELTGESDKLKLAKGPHRS